LTHLAASPTDGLTERPWQYRTLHYAVAR